jgi:predicted O-methyltransferase YrrM
MNPALSEAPPGLAAAAATAGDRFEFWVRIARAAKARRLAEIGVWRGKFAARLLHALPELESYLLIDPWRPLPVWNKPLNVDAGRFGEAFREALASTAFAGAKVAVLRGTTAEVADRIPDGSIDLAYIDGDHTLRGITIDLLRLRRKVRHGGLLGGDDYLADPWHHGGAHEPTLVRPFARYFAEAEDLPFVALPFGQFLIVNDIRLGTAGAASPIDGLAGIASPTDPADPSR